MTNDEIALKQRFIRAYKEFAAADKAGDVAAAALKAHECNALLGQIEPWKSMKQERRS